MLPTAPEVTREQWEKARKTGRYEPIAFNEYKFVAQLVAVVARISKEHGVFREIPTQHYHVLTGLMNQCARLMLATLDLSHEGKFGETTAIIFRCIIESGIKVIWLCTKPSQERFDRYLCDGLKPEIELKDIILSNVENNDGEHTPIERRMLESIERHIKAAEVTEQQIRESKKMPDAAALLLDIGFNRIMYVALLRMGAHHVHGTWTFGRTGIFFRESLPHTLGHRTFYAFDLGEYIRIFIVFRSHVIYEWAANLGKKNRK